MARRKNKALIQSAVLSVVVMLAGAQLERDAAAAFVSAQAVDAPVTERAGSCKVSRPEERYVGFVLERVRVLRCCVCVWGCVCVCVCVCVLH